MSLGFPEVIIILVILLVVFGGKKLPNVMGDLAKGLRGFKDGLKSQPTAPPARDVTPEPERLEPPRGA
jgi:sec-independent protein translocase protein TatA